MQTPEAGHESLPNTVRMLVSREKSRYTSIDARKVGRGRFFTEKSTWLLPQVLAFIRKVRPRSIVDPFAGRGDLLRVIGVVGKWRLFGYDIHRELGWHFSDSLIRVPRHKGALVLTNPPFLAKHSAKRKRVWPYVQKYFGANPHRNDLYQIALDRCREAVRFVVAIVPETFINSDYKKDCLFSITILENNPFSDTDCPVCIVCFDGIPKTSDRILVYKDTELVGTLADIEAARLRPCHYVAIRFNDPKGRIGLRAVDLADPSKPIQFMRRSELNYDLKRIKHSSRLVTFVEIPDLRNSEVPYLVAAANEELSKFRCATSDLALSPFKGNTKGGQRRRRLDYQAARVILEKALARVGYKGAVQASLVLSPFVSRCDGAAQ